MKNKKETNNIVIYIAMVLLLAIIALPPVFRSLIPKEISSTNKPINKNKLSILTCKKESLDNLYSTSIKTKYQNNIVKTVTFNYNMLLDTTTPAEGDTITQEPTIINDPDIVYFKTLNDATIVESKNRFEVLINNTTLENNEDVTLRSKYFNELSVQQDYYKNLGFICNSVSS